MIDRCPCGLPAETRTPHPMCRACAVAFFKGVVRVGSALAEIGRTPSDLAIPPVPSRIRDHTKRHHHMTHAEVQSIRIQYEQGVSKSVLARQFGCTWTNIYLIVNRKTHKAVGAQKDTTVA